jgi:SAM-dependent methyltransferase
MSEEDKTGLIYFEDGNLIAESGSARIYSMNNELFLELGVGHNLWALESELPDYIWQLKDYPKGSCLEIGLGLGVASRYILTFPRVEELTTVEKNENVIEVQKEANPIDDDRHLVLNADGLVYAYETRRKYDFIFIDCYSHIDEDTLPLIADMAYACRRILKDDGKVIGWWDEATPEDFVDTFFSLFK